MSLRRLSSGMVVVLALVAAALPSSAVGRQVTSETCLDVEPEVSAGRLGSPTFLLATLRTKTGDSTACNGPLVDGGSPERIDFELIGANDSEHAGPPSDSPELPDAVCEINPDYYIEARCTVAVWGDEEGLQTVRAWIDEDRADPPQGIVEADRAEGTDETTEPGNGCVGATSFGEPDCTDVVEIEWRSRPSCASATEPSGSLGRIAVYRSGKDVKAGIFTIDHDGSDPRRLGAPEDLRDYLWSPDHEKLVLTTGFINSLELSVMDADGSHVRRLTDDYQLDEGAAWSPDSRRLVYASSTYRKYEPSQLKVVTATGHDRKLLTHGAFDSTDPDWAPNGKRIVYAHYDISDHTVSALVTIDPEGNHRRTLLKQKDTLFEYPQYSPDGKWILFRKHFERTGNRELFLMSSRGRHVRRLTHSHAVVTDFQWSPDGDKIVYEFESDPGWAELRVIDADGAHDHEIARQFGLSVGFVPSWSPDSSLVAYQQSYELYDPDRSINRSDVWVSTVDGHCSQAITSTPDVTEESPSWITPAATSNPFGY